MRTKEEILKQIDEVMEEYVAPKWKNTLHLM